jgi:single-strand DNA-binding protein
MANQIQKVEYEGYLTADPVMRFLPSGTPVTNFTIGSNNQYTDKDGKKVKETTWIRVSAFGKQAEIVNEYCIKGSWVIVEGRLKPDAETGGPRMYTGNDGVMRTSFEVTANPMGIRILKGKPFENEAEDDGGLPY